MPTCCAGGRSLWNSPVPRWRWRDAARCVPTALQPRRDGLESRQTTIVLEKYGIVWQSTCGVADAGDYPEYEVTFRTMQQSLEIRGVWSTLYAVEGR